jgi:hypothetical protein
MTILIHKTEALKLAYKVNKLTVEELWDFVDELKKLEDVANTTGQGNFNFSAVKQRITFNEFKGE